MTRHFEELDDDSLRVANINFAEPLCRSLIDVGNFALHFATQEQKTFYSIGNFIDLKADMTGAWKVRLKRWKNSGGRTCTLAYGSGRPDTGTCKGRRGPARHRGRHRTLPGQVQRDIAAGRRGGAGRNVLPV